MKGIEHRQKFPVCCIPRQSFRIPVPKILSWKSHSKRFDKNDQSFSTVYYRREDEKIGFPSLTYMNHSSRNRILVIEVSFWICKALKIVRISEISWHFWSGKSGKILFPPSIRWITGTKSWLRIFQMKKSCRLSRTWRIMLLRPPTRKFGLSQHSSAPLWSTD